MKLPALQWLRPFATDWYQTKVFIEHASRFSMDALHVMIGVSLQLIIALLFRSSVGRWFPLLAVLVLELINETSDFVVDIWPSTSMQFGESAKDVMLTMFVPTLLFLVARYRPKLLR